MKQGRSSSIGAKINSSFVLRQLTDDLKKKTLKKNLSNIENQFHILLNNNHYFIICYLKGEFTFFDMVTFFSSPT